MSDRAYTAQEAWIAVDDVKAKQKPVAAPAIEYYEEPVEYYEEPVEQSVSGSKSLPAGMSLKQILLVLYILNVMLGLLYMNFIPLWQFPDEVQHTEYVMLLAESKRLPFVDPAMIDEQFAAREISTMQQYQFWRSYLRPGPTVTDSFTVQRLKGTPAYTPAYNKPPLYFLVCVPIYKLVGFLGGSLDMQVYAIRFFGVLISSLIPLLTFATARVLFPSRQWLPIWAALLVTFIPMRAAIGAALGEGAFADVLSASTLFMLVLFLRSFRLRALFAGIVFLVLAFLTKKTGYALIPLIPVTLILAGLDRTHRRYLAVGLAIIAGFIAVPLIAFTSPFAEHLKLFIHVDPSYFINNFTSGFYLRKDVLNQYASNDIALPLLFRSFWAQFGWLTLPLDLIYYQILLVFSALPLLGLATLPFRRKNAPLSGIALKGIVLALLATLSLFSMILLTAIPSPTGIKVGLQGRYMFGALVPLGILAGLGLGELIPSRLRQAGLILLVCLLFGLNALCLIKYIIPHFYL